MKKLTIVIPRYFDLATCELSGGVWTAGFPLSNLKDPQPSKYARTADLVEANATFTVHQTSSPQTFDTLILAKHNMIAGALVTIHSANTQGALGVSGNVGSPQTVFEGYPSSLPPNLSEGHNGFLNSMITGFSGTLSWAQVKFTSLGSIPDGFLKIGRGFFGIRREFTYNVAYGYEWGFLPGDFRQKTPFNYTMMDVRPRQRFMRLPLDWASQADAEDFLYNFIRFSGTSADMFIHIDRDDSSYIIQRMMHCTLVAPPRIARVRFNMWRTLLDLEELL